MFGIQLDDIKINGKSTGACKIVGECLIAIDSGMADFSMPKKGIKNLMK